MIVLKTIFRPLRRAVAFLNPFRALRRAVFAVRNWRRGRAKIDYVLFLLPRQMPALPEPRGWLRERVLGPAPLSLNELDRIFERIGDDPRPKGVILYLRGLSLSFANLQNLRNSILRLRQTGKRVICFAQNYSNADYFIATAADEIVLQPGGELNVLGLRSEATFLKGALDRIGVRLDSVAISPYKGAFDQFTRESISPEGREQLEWLLDSQYDLFVNTIAEGRQTTTDAVRAFIDSAPHLDEDALSSGSVDAVETEEDLHRRLTSQHILPWKEADRKVLHRWRKPAEKYVALLKVSGLMMQGESGSPPVPVPVPFIGGDRAGDLTVVRQVRNLMRNKNAAAVILYVDSGGGDSAAAEAMTAALTELAKDRPLVVYMNSVAASGGYHIATPARWIVAQPGTITGSIGVLGAKLVMGEAYEKLGVNRLTFTRGANADLYDEGRPYTDEQRARALRSIQHVYHQFVNHVARSRSMTFEAVDAVGAGRVWTGTQAYAHGLVDELGDLRAALAKARSLADLPDDAPLVMVSGKLKPLPAQLAESSNPAAILAYLRANLHSITSGLPQMLLPFEWSDLS